MGWLDGTWFGPSSDSEPGWFEGAWFGEGTPSVPVAAPTPLELYDAVPGNRGLRGPAKLLMHFDEPTGMMPSDAEGNVEDFAAGPGGAGSAVSAWTGRGRYFDPDDLTALISSDRAGRDTLLQHDATIQTILSIDTDPGDLAPKTLIARGISTTSPQLRSYRIVLQRTSAANAKVFWEWQDSAAVSQPQEGAEFQLLAPQATFLLTATRRWEAIDRVVVRYYIDDRMIGEFVSTDGDIAGGTTGQTMIGGLYAGLVWDATSHYHGTIDELAVYDYEMSPDEVRAVWRRLHEHQPGGVETLRGLVPPGAPWMRDPGNKIGRRMKAVGQGLGSAVASIDELLEMWLPDRAPRDQLARWESIYGVASRPRDSLDTRRARLLGVTGREEGYSIPAIKAALLELLDVGDPADLEIVEGQNVIEDAFATLEDERWLRGNYGTWAIVADAVRGTAPIGTDVRWESRDWGVHMRTTLDTGGHGPNHVQVKLLSGAVQNNTGVGLLIANRRDNSGLWFGLWRDGFGTQHIAYRTVLSGVESATVTLVPAIATPFWLRLTRPAGFSFGGSGQYIPAWSSDGVAWTTGATITTGVLDFDWGGLAVWGTVAALGGAVTADFDDWLSLCEDGSRPHHWYVYRDPALGGSPDIIGAQKLLDRLKPAHTHAAVIQSKSVLANNARDGLAGRGPMGVLHTP